MSKYQVVSQFIGYENKKEVTNQQPGILVTGSKNVVSTDGDTVAIRKGYSLLGSANATLNPIEASYEWQKLRIGQLALRSYDDELEVFFSSDIGETGSWTGTDDWIRVADSWSAVDFNFAPIYNSTESDDTLLFVNGDANVYEWSGGIAEIASVTANTITKEGSASWSARGFFTSGTRRVVIGGTAYTYTGGETTDTLTGVTPDPSVGGVVDGDIAVQQFRTNSNSPASGVENDLVEVLDNQVFVGSLNSRQIYVSANDDYTDYTFSSPRLPGEGALLTLDAPPVGFDVSTDGDGEKFLRISAGKDFWYQTKFVLSADLTKENLNIVPLKNSPLQGAVSQSAIGKIKNFTVFISNEPTLDFLGRVQDVNTPQSKPISDRIKADFDSYNFTGAHVKYYKNNLYIAVPEESKLLVYNVEKGFWEAPWDMPAGRLAIIGSDLCLHSNVVPETYKLFQGYNDNDNAINAIARFSYMNYGDRVSLKSHTETYLEGYIGTSTELTRKVLLDYEGYTATSTETIEGDDANIIFTSNIGGALGKQSLGKQPLGGGNAQSEVSKFRVIHTEQRQDFYEELYEFSTNDIDFQWEIIAFGSDVTLSTNKPVDIKK